MAEGGGSSSPLIIRAGSSTLCLVHAGMAAQQSHFTFGVQIKHRQLAAALERLDGFLGDCSSPNLFLGVERRQSGFCSVRLSDLPCCVAEC